MGTIRITHDAVLPVPADQVWAVLSDYPRDPEWRTGVEAMTAEPADAVRPGTVTVELMRFGGRTYRNVGVVDAVVPGRSIRWRTTEGADADGVRAVEPRPDGTSRVSLEMDVRPSGFERLLAPILARKLAANLRADLARLGDVVAREVASPEAPRP